MDLFTGVQHLCTFSIATPPLIYHLLSNIWKASYTISASIFIEVPYLPHYRTDKFISCVVRVPHSGLSLWRRNCNRMDSGVKDDTCLCRTSSFFMTMQGVTPLLLTRTSCAAPLAMGDSGTSTIITRYESMRLWSLRQSERTSAKETFCTRNELVRAIGRSIRNINKDGRWFCTTPSKYLVNGDK